MNDEKCTARRNLALKSSALTLLFIVFILILTLLDLPPLSSQTGLGEAIRGTSFDRLAAISTVLINSVAGAVLWWVSKNPQGHGRLITIAGDLFLLNAIRVVLFTSWLTVRGPDLAHALGILM